ncbi:hypothetical protein HPP92_026521 [Vanilla planifolia]|uniref:Uncharacterized protein n=1 Tax=Vanilla planifolia TaxID=51239 RepID=A0A835U708_VANPL|nr:hypothetical protein HPP92_026749 [Vanilla planifolia]KAG0450863.1 hypothetical protein HPP92_026521 [Vanilla planifolia]
MADVNDGIYTLEVEGHFGGNGRGQDKTFEWLEAKVYRLFGWEYRKPERVTPACPYKPQANRSVQSTGEQAQPELGKTANDEDKQD